MTSTKYSAGFDIPQPVERMFPLFSPEGEKRLGVTGRVTGSDLDR
jgi:hypothetical protein